VKIDEPYLVYIRDAIGHIEQLTPSSEEDLTKGSFTHDLAAILYYLHTLSEATQRLSEEAKSRYSEIDWPGIAGFRNRLVHGYLNVNTAIVWNVVKNYLPSLKVVVLKMLQELGE
jgi:uncharacterized protein with HEPN domain